jgi:hypothetical protein
MPAILTSSIRPVVAKKTPYMAAAGIGAAAGILDFALDKAPRKAVVLGIGVALIYVVIRKCCPNKS